MAGKRKDKYENALQSISDFIFKNSGKRVKVKPGKISGASGTDQMAKALAEIASKPWLYISDPLMKSINETIGSQALLQFYVDQLNEEKYIGADKNEGRFRVRGFETANVIANPRKYVKSIFDKAKAEREWASKVGMAGYIDGAAALLWAKKQGLSWQEGMKMFSAASYGLQPIHREDAHKLMAETAGYQSFNDRKKAEEAGKDLYSAINSSALTRGGKVSTASGALGNDFMQTLSPSERKLLKDGMDALSAGQKLPDVTSRSKFDDLLKRQAQFGKPGDKYSGRYNAIQGQLKKLEVSPGVRKYTDSEVDAILKNYVESRDISKLDLTGAEFQNLDKYVELNPTTYRRLLMKNIDAKLRVMDPVKDKDEMKALTTSMGVISLWQRAYGGPVPEDYAVLMDKVKSEMGNPSTSSGRKAELQKILDQINKENNAIGDRTNRLGAYTGVSNIPKIGALRKDLANYIGIEKEFWEGKFRELSDLRAKGTITPDQERELAKVGRRLSLLSVEQDGLRTLPWAGARITVGQVSNMFRAYKNIFQGGPGSMLMNGMFWVSDAAGPFAPGAMGKIKLMSRKFENGVITEAFMPTMRGDIHPSYAQLTALYYLSPASLLKTFFFTGEGWAYMGHIKESGAKNLLNHYKKDIIGVLGITEDAFNESMAKNYLNIVDQLKGSTNPLIKKFIGRVESLSNAAEKLASRVDFYNRYLYGPYSKMASNINQWIMSRVGRLLKGRIQSEMWNSAVDKFVAGAIGLKQLIYYGVEAVLQAANITVSGGALSMLVGFVSYVVTEGIYKFAQPILEVLAGIFSMFGILLFALILFLVGAANGAFSRKSDPYRAYYPGSAIACTTYNPHAGMYPPPPDDVPSTGYPPSDSSCPFTFTPAICTQGDGGNSSSYHQQTKAIDIGTNSVPVNEDVWHAPADGKITKFQATNICQGTGKNYGGWLVFQDNSGNVYTLLHVKALAPVGAVKKGTAVAITQRDLTPDGWCWTGPHFHLHVTSNGSYVDSEDWYRNKLKCSFSVCP